MIIQPINIAFILVNLFFMLLSLVSLRHSMRAKYKFRHRLLSLFMVLLFGANSYYIYYVNYQ